MVILFKVTFSGPRQFLASENPLKCITNVLQMYLYYMLKALFVLNIFKFLSWLFGHLGKRLDKKAKVNFKLYNVTDWETNNYSTYITQCEAIRQWIFGQLIEYSRRNIFVYKSCRKWSREASSRPHFVLWKAFYKVKVSNLDLKYSGRPPTWTYSKNKLYNISGCWSWDFDFP